MSSLAPFSLPPPRSVGDPNPPGDMNNVVDCVTSSGQAYFNIVNTAFAGGAFLDGSSDSTAAIQACMNAAATFGAAVYIPGGIQFRVSSLTWVAGTVLRGVYSGTFPGDDTITTASVLSRLASTNEDLIVVPDGTNYGGLFDIAIDGNKSQNTAGYGINIQDGASGQECQIRIERCFIHDNPYSNIYLGNNRRANHLTNSIFNQSGTMDGITVAGSDNKIINCITGSNARAGVCVGTNQTQNWAAAGSPFASDVTVVTDCDIFLNEVGIAVAQFAAQAIIIGNGIDRNTKQGITVYDGDTHQVMGNALHSNGTAANNTYGHIDVASGVTQVGIANNTFGPLDAGISNVASYCVVTHADPTIGAILGNIGVMDSGSTVGGLITPAAAASPPQAVAAKTGLTIQGSGGEDIMRLVRSGGSVVFKMTQGGVVVSSSPFQMTPQSSPVAVSGEGVLYVNSTDDNLHYIAPSGEGGADVNLVSGSYLCPPTQYAPSTQVTFASTFATFTAVSSANVNTGSFTASPSGSAVVITSFVAEAQPAANVVGFGLCAHGTNTPMIGNSVITKLAVTGQSQPVTCQFLVGGLTAGSAYTFDLMQAVAAGGTVTTLAFANTSTAPTLGALTTGAPVVMTVQAV